MIVSAGLGKTVKTDTHQHPRVSLTHVTKNQILDLRIAGSQANLHSALGLVEALGVIRIRVLLQEFLVIARYGKNQCEKDE